MALIIFFFVAILVTTVCLIKAVTFAYQAKKIDESVSIANRRLKNNLQSMHINWIMGFHLIGATSVALILLIVVIHGGNWGPLPVLYTHRLLVIASVILLGSALFFNGKKSKKTHRKIVYYFLFVFMLTLTTGLWLLAKHPLLWG